MSYTMIFERFRKKYHRKTCNLKEAMYTPCHRQLSASFGNSLSWNEIGSNTHTIIDEYYHIIARCHHPSNPGSVCHVVPEDGSSLPLLQFPNFHRRQVIFAFLWIIAPITTIFPHESYTHRLADQALSFEHSGCICTIQWAVTGRYGPRPSLFNTIGWIT